MEQSPLWGLFCNTEKALVILFSLRVDIDVWEVMRAAVAMGKIQSIQGYVDVNLN